MRKGKLTKAKLAAYIVLLMGLLITVFPSAWILSLSFRYEEEVLEDYFFLIPKHFTLENYPKAIHWLEGFGLSVFSLYRNSLIVSVSAVIISLLASILAGYAFCRFKFWGKNTNFYILFFTLMVPPQATLIPTFVLVKTLGLYDNILSLILIYSAFGIPLCVFILTGFFRSLPSAMAEAALIDGCSDFGILWRIYLPLSRPALAALSIFWFLQNWNEYLMALVYINSPSRMTLPVGISYFVGTYMVNWVMLAATIIMSVLPILVVYLLFQKWFVKGLTAGAIKF